MTDERDPWDRLPRESSRAYMLFRRFRDLGPLRQLDMLVDDTTTSTQVRRHSKEHNWHDRCQAWDDTAHRLADQQRLEAIRGMHDLHQKAGRAVLTKALAALSTVDPRDIPPYAAARLLELGARLERNILVYSVEELQGVMGEPEEDPWAAVAHELESVPGT